MAGTAGRFVQVAGSVEAVVCGAVLGVFVAPARALGHWSQRCRTTLIDVVKVTLSHAHDAHFFGTLPSKVISAGSATISIAQAPGSNLVRRVMHSGSQPPLTAEATCPE